MELRFVSCLCSFRSCTPSVRRNYSVKKMGDQEKSATGCLSEIDRLSDLPDSILHHIVSFLGTKEACRTSILSKRWVNIWSTGYILDFNPKLFKNVWKDSDRFVSFIETTMQRYSKANLSIRKLTLEYENFDKDIEPERIDRWLGIAVKNQVEDLSLDIDGTSEFLSSYGLPMILFSAKSLISLKCSNLRVPRCPTVMVISLQFLELWYLDIDEHMLHHLIRSCPLRKLLINGCTGIYNLSIPKCSKLESLNIVETIHSDGLVNVETSSILHFSYCSAGDQVDAWWPFNFSLASKKNLSELNFYFIHIPDNVVDKLVTELSSIKIISFSQCSMPKNIRIASLTLEELVLIECCDLANIVLDAPQLKTFCYDDADLQQLSSITSSHSICNASLNFTHRDLDTQSLIKINRLLSRSKCCKVFSIDIGVVSELDFNQLCEIHAAPPCEVEELKLSLSCSVSKKSFLIDLLDGVFWSCRPSTLSLTFDLLYDNQDAIIRNLLEIMEEKVKCWKNFLKRFEIKGTNCSRLTMFWRVELRLRLYW